MYSKRDAKLDNMLQRKVKIVWNDGSCDIGVLNFQDDFDFNKGIKPHSYYIIRQDAVCISFKKSHVKSVEKYEI